MGKNFNILICAGSFKDVYSPMESCEVINSAIKGGINDGDDIITNIIPIVDGGEYSNDVLFAKFGFEKIHVDNVIDPRGVAVDSYYLSIDKNTAFIGSSQILGLSPVYEKDKNPLHLTSYGLGQLIKHAITGGYKRVILGLGGTSIVDGGIGMAQALGVTFLDDRGGCLVPHRGVYLTGSDLSRVRDVDWNSISSNFRDISIIALCDSRINIRQMHDVTNLKISRYYNKEREAINRQLESTLLVYCEIVAQRCLILEPDRSDYFSKLCEQEGVGVAGGIGISLFAIFQPELVDGITYFVEKLGLEDAIKSSDMVITGEGKFDFSSRKGKGPVGISNLAKKYNKPVLLLCGSVVSPLEKHFADYMSKDLPSEVRDVGISAIISCHEYYKGVSMPGSYNEEVALYKKVTPYIFKKALRSYFQNRLKSIL